jgi:hypothetical protein
MTRIAAAATLFATHVTPELQAVIDQNPMANESLSPWWLKRDGNSPPYFRCNG